VYVLRTTAPVIFLEFHQTLEHMDAADVMYGTLSNNVPYFSTAGGKWGPWTVYTIKDSDGTQRITVFKNGNICNRFTPANAAVATREYTLSTDSIDRSVYTYRGPW
jgi:hypothetical protein